MRTCNELQKNIFTILKIIDIIALTKEKRCDDMENQRFIPEGWEMIAKPITHPELTKAYQTGDIMQGLVTKCDSNYNLYVDMGNHIQGMIPREEVEAVNIDETGFPKPNVCARKSK